MHNRMQQHYDNKQIQTGCNQASVHASSAIPSCPACLLGAQTDALDRQGHVVGLGSSGEDNSRGFPRSQGMWRFQTHLLSQYMSHMHAYAAPISSYLTQLWFHMVSLCLSTSCHICVFIHSEWHRLKGSPVAVLLAAWQSLRAPRNYFFCMTVPSFFVTLHIRSS